MTHRFFDNVGGKILDEVILRMKPHGQIAACGAMACECQLSDPYTRKLIKHLC